ncbi:MAG TPA: hypothetical protein VGV61_07595, partial [Thermoanaerobaculia bacterium]|nr:hypothetical protein [Thermoanaerobaculia bacterium]
MLWLFWMLTNLGALSIGIGGVLLARRRGPAAGPLVAAPAPPPPGPPVHDLPPATRESAAPGGTAPAWDEPFEGFDEPATAVTNAVPEEEAEEPAGGLGDVEPRKA